MLWVALHFPCLPHGTLERIAAWACQFTPRVSLEPPRALLAEIEGSLRRFGGSDGLLEKLRAGLAELGFEAALAMAATPRAALWLARGGGGRLEGLPIEVVGLEKDEFDFFQEIGILTLGELLRLPREGLARRCGRRLLRDLDRAFGVTPEPRAFFAPPPRFAAALELPGEVAHAEGLLFAARRLLAQLEGLLAARQEGVRRFRVCLLHRKKEFAAVEIGLASPARETERFVQLLRERLAAAALQRPVEAIRVEAGDFEPWRGFTAGLFGDARAQGEAWARLIERLRARLGRDAIHGLGLHADHRPERAWRRVESGTEDLKNFEKPGPRPLWLLEPPRRLPEGSFELLAGPERIESGWWDGAEAKRDYFVARRGDASLVWVYRGDGDWFLHGIFA